jgi:predicted nucleic acid-binding protein
MVIVDSTVWIDYLNGASAPHTTWLEDHLTQERLGLLDLMVCEVLQGLGSDKEAAAVLTQLKRFEIFETGGVDLAASAAANYRNLRSRGITVRKTMDCLIATWCIRQGHSLLHNDRDFDPFEKHLALSVVKS